MPSLKGEGGGTLCPWWHHQPTKPPQNYQPLETQKGLNLVGGRPGAATSPGRWVETGWAVFICGHPPLFLRGLESCSDPAAGL